MLRELRNKYGLSQSAAADLAGVTANTWSRWERGIIAIPAGSFSLAVARVTNRHRRRPAKKGRVAS